MQIKRLRVRNFQSIKDLEINFEENKAYGLVGANEIGKSALLKAIDCLFYNVPSVNVKYFVRDGEESFWVQAESFDGYVITLSRGKQNYYQMIRPDGSEFSAEKLEGAVPPEIEAVFNLYRDTKTGEKLNVRAPEDHLLMVYTTEGENYAIFQKALKTEDCAKAIKTLNSEEKEIKDDVSVLDMRVKDEIDSANRIPNTDELEANLKSYEGVIDDLHKEISNLENFIEVSNKIEILEGKSISKEIKEFSPFELEKQIEIVGKLNKLIELFGTIDSLEKSTEHSRKVVESASLLSDNDLSGVVNLTRYIETSATVTKLEKSVEARKSAISQFTGLTGSYDEINSLVTVISKMEKIDENTEQISKMENKLHARKEFLVGFEQVAPTYEVVNAFGEFLGSIDRIKLQTASVTTLKQELEDKQKEIQQFMRENAFCSIVQETGACPFDKQEPIVL